MNCIILIKLNRSAKSRERERFSIAVFLPKHCLNACGTVLVVPLVACITLSIACCVWSVRIRHIKFCTLVFAISLYLTTFYWMLHNKLQNIFIVKIECDGNCSERETQHKLIPSSRTIESIRIILIEKGM